MQDRCLLVHSLTTGIPFRPVLYLFPGLPDLRMIPHRSQLSVAYNGRIEKLGIGKQLFLGGLAGDVAHIKLLIGAAVLADQLLKAELLADAFILPGGEPLFHNINILIFDAALLEPAFRFFRVEVR